MRELLRAAPSPVKDRSEIKRSNRTECERSVGRTGAVQ